MKKLNKRLSIMLGVALGAISNISVMASEYTTMETDLILYSNPETALYENADLNSQIIINKEVFPDNAPVHVIGITSNGFFKIELEGNIYYVEGTGLQESSSTTQVAPLNDESRVAIDLGYGITFDSPKYVDEYYLDIYKGKIEITDAKITKKNADSMPDVFGLGTLSLKYKPFEYGDYNGRNMYVSARVVFLDKDGFEIDNRIIGANQASDPINAEITQTILIPKNTVTITVQAD